MSKKLSNILACSLFFFVLLFPNSLITGSTPTIASRISQITEISVTTDNSYDKPNTTLFRINVSVEILNRNTENYTVIETADYYPKIVINASFVNQTLGLEPIIISLNLGTEYIYQPAITEEYESIKFYINQTNLACLPDGNYTIIRPINTASKYVGIEAAEMLPTLIRVTSGITNITYANFTDLPLPEVSSAFTATLTTTFLLLISFFVMTRKNSTKLKKAGLF